MCTHNQCFRAKKKIIIIFNLKINIFTAVKYCYKLHGRVCVMVTEASKETYSFLKRRKKSNTFLSLETEQRCSFVG